jgi:hypothetical protein
VYLTAYSFSKFCENLNLNFNYETQLQEGLQSLKIRHVGNITLGIHFLIYYIGQTIIRANMKNWQ